MAAATKTATKTKPTAKAAPAVKAPKVELTKAQTEAKIVELQAKNKASKDSAERIGLRRQIRNLQKSIGTFVPRDERTPKVKAQKAVAAATKPAAKKAAPAKK